MGCLEDSRPPGLSSALRQFCHYFSIMYRNATNFDCCLAERKPSRVVHRLGGSCAILSPRSACYLSFWHIHHYRTSIVLDCCPADKKCVVVFMPAPRRSFHYRPWSVFSPFFSSPFSFWSFDQFCSRSQISRYAIVTMAFLLSYAAYACAFPQSGLVSQTHV